MLPRYYRSLAVLCASLPLLLGACSTSAPEDTVAGRQTAASGPPTGEPDTEATIWTVLGLAKKESQEEPGPKTGMTVSPILWQAAHDTLDFVPFTSEDPIGGSLVTDWYSPKGKPTERYKVNVFILDRALRSDSMQVSVFRQQRNATGGWADTSVDPKVERDLEITILNRARQIRRARATPL
jgi:hypothetical protein